MQDNGGDAYAIFDPIYADYNGDYGFFLKNGGANAIGGGDAIFVMDEIYARYNGESGIWFGGAPAFADDGSAWAEFRDVDVSYNPDFGIYIPVDAAYAGGDGAQATLIMRNVHANYMANGSGVYLARGGAVAGGADGSATALLGISASYNADYGVYFGGDVAHATGTGNAYVSWHGGTADYNGYSASFLMGMWRMPVAVSLRPFSRTSMRHITA